MPRFGPMALALLAGEKQVERGETGTRFNEIERVARYWSYQTFAFDHGTAS